MGLISYTLGQESIILRVVIGDSSSTTGTGLVALSSASSGMKIATIADNEDAVTVYTVAGSTIESISVPGTYVAPTATKCRFAEIDDTNVPGLYEIQIANARYAVTGAKSIIVAIHGATNAVPCFALIPLTQDDPYDATENIRTALRATRLLFVSTTGSSGNDGLTPSTAKALPSQACAIATAGDAILVEAGTYDQVTASVSVPDDVQLIGAGWRQTIINSQVANPTSICKPGSRSVIDGFTFQGNLATDVAQRGLGLGVSEATFTDAVVRNCRIYGNADGVQIAKASANATIKFYNCILESGFDSFATSLSSTNIIDFYDCEFNADASLLGGYTSGGAICRSIVNSNASRITAYNCRYRATGANTTNSGVQNSSTGSITLHGARGFDCDIYDVQRTGGTINLFDVPYSLTKITGTVNVFGSAANTVGWLGTIPATPTTAGVPTVDASGISGTGARTVTITVNDGATALENAIVRMVEGANAYTATTNVSGVATFNLDDATYTVSISKQGYSYAGTTLVVNGTETVTYSMTAITISAPADPALTAAYLTTYDAQGAVAGSTVISFKLEDGAGTTGYSYSTTTFTGTSNASTGLLTINLVKSTSYSARRGNGEWVDFTTGSGSTYALPEVLGTP